MSKILTPALQISSHTLIRRERELPLAGEVLKGVGDTVSAEETVARANLPGNLQILRVAEKLGIEPFEVMRGLKVKTGDEVRQGDLICEHRGLFGLFRSTFVSPTGGKIEYIAENIGHLGLREPSRSVEINAYLDGRITSLREGKSATVECEAAFLQGIFGVGGERRGILTPLGLSPEVSVTEAHIPLKPQGQVLFGGTRPTGEALRLAAQRGAVGFITGAIDDRALASYLGYDLGLAMTGDEAVTMTVIITEGFGQLPMSPRALNLLSSHKGGRASINGATQVRAGAVRPEVIISLAETEAAGSSSPQEELSQNILRKGSRVRIIRYPWFGKQGTIEDLPLQLSRLETGTLSRVAVVRLDGGDSITASRANLELVEE